MGRPVEYEKPSFYDPYPILNDPGTNHLPTITV